MTSKRYKVSCIILAITALLFVTSATLHYLNSKFVLGMLCTTTSIFLMNMSMAAFILYRLRSDNEDNE